MGLLIPLEDLVHTAQAFSIIHLCLWAANHTVLNDERSQIVRQHVRSGHTDRFKHCATGDCSSLVTPQNGELQPQ